MDVDVRNKIIQDAATLTQFICIAPAHQSQSLRNEKVWNPPRTTLQTAEVLDTFQFKDSPSSLLITSNTTIKLLLIKCFCLVSTYSKKALELIVTGSLNRVDAVNSVHHYTNPLLHKGENWEKAPYFALPAATRREKGMGQDIRMVLYESRISTETPAAKEGDTPKALVMLILRLKGLIVPLVKLSIFLLPTGTASKISRVREEVFIPL